MHNAHSVLHKGNIPLRCAPAKLQLFNRYIGRIDIELSRLAIVFEKVYIIRLLQSTEATLYFAWRIAHLLAAC